MSATRNRIAARVRRHLTYANVMATVAVFIALGGGAYAAARINGHKIEIQSLPGNRIVQDSVGNTEIGSHVNVRGAQIAGRAYRADRARIAGRAYLSDRSKQLLVSSAQSSGASADPTDIVATMSTGETRELFSMGPFTVRATCENMGGGVALVSLQAMSTKSGSWLAGRSAMPADEWVTVWSDADDQQVLYDGTNRYTPWSLVAPGGVGLSFGPPALGLHVLGGDCAVVEYAVA